MFKHFKEEKYLIINNFCFIDLTQNLKKILYYLF